MQHKEIHKRYLKRKVSNEATPKAPKELQKRILQQLSFKVTVDKMRHPKDLWMKEQISKFLSSDEPVVSLITDIWSCNLNDTSLLKSLPYFMYKHLKWLTLVSIQLAERISSVQENWNIPQEHVHLADQ